MLRHLDFHCTDCDRIFEEFTDSAMTHIPCPQCSAPARRILSAVRIDRSAIALTAGASPESIAHFDRLHQQRKIIEEKTFKEHGDYGKAPGSD
jgi:putative FmdB family regulatory protein